MKNPLAAAATILLLSPASFAAPTISGNTISWPDDGWYQVQTAETYISICGGGRSCEVENGDYVVTNHSKGERYENVRVGPLNDPNSPVKVSGSTISWPDDGWYQVQTMGSWETVCRGRRSCDVADGVYKVTNHTTGQQFPSVFVVTETSDTGLATLGNSGAFYNALRQALINNRNNTGLRVDVQIQAESIADTAQPGLPAAVPASDGPQDTADASPFATGNEVTSTNVQEVGVDEQDRVKVNAAGSQMFVLNNEYYPIVFPADPIPIPFPEPEILTIPEEPRNTNAARLSIIGSPQRLKTTLRILTLDSETPDARSVNEVDIELNNRTANGFYLYENNGQSSAIVTASGSGFWGFWNRPASFFGQQSLITKVDVTDPANASPTDNFTIDGQIISSRRIGNSLFFASRYYPAIPGVNPWNQDADTWRSAVEAANLADLMPAYSRNGTDERTPLVNASSCFVAPGAAEQPYYSPDIITLGVIDLATMKLRDSECFLGATETLYANTESVFLATTKYNYSIGPVTLEGEEVDTDVPVFPIDLVWSDPRQTTDIHQFDIKEDQLSYSGSGSVQGHLGWNQLQKPFRMSESGGYLRVATMNDRQSRNQSPILLTILKTDGRGKLKTVSKLPNDSNPEFIGKPGERLYASRFLGDRGYLVTFRQTDPLYVIDLADPANPKVTGELEIEGYSDYLQPVDENYLLGIGKNAVAAEGDPGDGRGAWVQGMKLSLFDVSDPSAPAEVQSVLLGERGTNSVALGNHRAITIQPATEAHPLRVSFGANVYGNAAPASSPSLEEARQYAPWSYTGLHGYDVTTGPNASITPRGALIVDKNTGSKWSGYGDDRAVMVNDAVFYVNGKDVYPALWDNLSVAVEPR